jgi:hypothetical protein
MSARKKVALALLALLWLAFSFPTYHYPSADELRRKARYLEQQLSARPGQPSDLSTLEQLNPEWGLFSLSYATYAFTNMAQLDSAFRPEAAKYVQLAIEKARSGYIPQMFRDSNARPFTDSSTSVLYLGHLNLMLGCHRLLNPASPYRALHDSLSASLHQRLAAAPGHCLESYDGGTWVPDNTVALASLYLHSELTGSSYQTFCRQWVRYARQHLCDPATGLLLSKPANRHQAAEEPRGSHLGWSIAFLYRFDPAFAAEQYRLYQQHCSTNFGVLRLYRERPGDYTTDIGDVDSGPLVLGCSIPANAFAFSNAVALGDFRNAQRLRRVIRIGSRDIETDDALHYGVRFVDLTVSPMAEALLLHAETMTPWRP